MSGENVGYINSQVNMLPAHHEIQFGKSNGWKSRSSLEKTLIIFSILCLGTLIGLAVAYGLTVSKKDSSENNICLKKGCILAASNLLQSIDFTAKPCNNFYQYACGDWVKKHSIPDHRDAYNAFVYLTDELNIELRNIFEDTYEEPLSNSERIVKDSYAACMNESVIEDLQGQPLIDFLNQAMGGWPLLIDDWDQSKFDWIAVLDKLLLYGKSYIISFEIEADIKNNSKKLIYIDQTELGFDRNYLLKKEYKENRDNYEKTITDIVTLLYNGTLNDQHGKDIHNIVNFEIELANLTKPPEQRRNHTAEYNKITLPEIETKYDQIDFKRYFLGLPADLKFDEHEPFIQSSPEYFEKLNDLIGKTDKRIIANYIGWRLANEYAIYLSKDFNPDAVTRWRPCVEIVTKNLDLAVGMLYVNRSFISASKEAAASLIKEVRATFEKELRGNDWMDKETKKFALEKLEKIDEKIAYPEKYVNLEELDKEYEGLSISEDAHFSNQINVDEFQANRQFKDFRKGRDKSRWISSPAEINAFYHGLTNSIIFPAGILQPPFFDVERPRSMNFGAAGMLIGHEITHGFDDQGSQYDGDGNLHQWWKHETQKKFEEKTKCLIDQYSSYSIPELNISLNGDLTQGEDIADNGGLKAAYMAYKKDVEKNGVELLLPGLDFSHDQLFFLSFANIWCSISQPYAILNNILTDDHTVEMFRVIGTVSNSLEFRIAFNCPKGSKMVREERCSVW